MSMIHDITSTTPRNKLPKRKGRGESSGHGKTSGRGNKGSKARVGTYIKRGYEGGQTPIFRRLPKRGFSNFNFANRFHIVNLEDLDRFAEGTVVDNVALIEAGLVPDDKLPVKILGKGAVAHKLTVIAGWYSKSALEKITQAGGTAQNTKGESFAFPKPKPVFVKRDKPAPGAAPAESPKKDKKGPAADAAGTPGTEASAPETAADGSTEKSA